MTIFNSYVKLPEGKHTRKLWKDPPCYSWENENEDYEMAIDNVYQRV